MAKHDLDRKLCEMYILPKFKILPIHYFQI